MHICAIFKTGNKVIFVQVCGEKIVAMEGYSVYNQNINIGAREDLR